MRKDSCFLRICRFVKSYDAKRGVAIELAIMVLVITSLFCTLLVSISITLNSNNDTMMDELTVHTKLDEIGDRFCCEVQRDTAITDIRNIFTSTYSEYIFSVVQSDDDYTLQVFEISTTEDLSDKIIFTVVVERSDEKLTVKKWAYN